jgi:CheY-like chemotaxis protein
MNISPISVLLIDDDIDDNYFHHLILQESTLVSDIKITENGFQALDYLRSIEKFPDLIFLDANMPKMNGWEFIEEYRRLSNEVNLSSIIIMLTTSLNPLDKKRALSTPGLNGFETKPLTPEMLAMVMHKYFSNS